MVQLLCVILGIVYWLRGRKIGRLSPADFPNAPEAEFKQWQDVKLRGVEIFFWFAWSTFFLSLCISFITLCYSSRITRFHWFYYTPQSIFLGLLLLIGLSISVTYESMAAKLKKKWRSHTKSG